MVILHANREDTLQKCTIYDDPVHINKGHDIHVHVTITGEKSEQIGDEGEYSLWQDTMIERRRSVLTEGRWVGKMGSYVSIPSINYILLLNLH